ncbi:MAG: hypothetical protein ACK512_06940, partial [Cyanobium sp.]
PEMRQFVRASFLLSRQCGLAGVDDASKSLFQLARAASGRRPLQQSPEFLLYGLLAALVGWRGAARVSLGLRRLMPRRNAP